MTYSLINIVPGETEESLIESILDYLETIGKIEYPKDPKTPREALLKDLFKERKERIKYQKVAFDEIENKVIALAYILIKTEDNPEFDKGKQIANFDLTVLKEYAHLEIIEELFITIVQETKNFDYVTTVKGCNIWEEEWNLWLKHEADHFDTVEVNRLYFDEVNWELMDQWREEGKRNAKFENISLLRFEECPEEILEDYSKLYTEAGNLIPYEDEDKNEEKCLETPSSRRTREEIRRNLGEVWLTLVSKEENGKLSGFTEITYSPEKAHIAVQQLTGVTPQYRGRGLGKWLKAEMLFLVKEMMPKVIVIHTGNSKVNAPMLAINERMGFRSVLTVKCFSLNIKENYVQHTSYLT